MQPSRPYRSQDAQQRVAHRRERLIAAAIEVFGTSGYRTATVGRVCAEAGLTKRYFYESFADSEALLLACYARVNEQLMQAMLVASERAGRSVPAQLEAACAAFFATIDDDVRIARITLFEILGVSAVVDDAYRSATDAFATALLSLAEPELIGPHLPSAGQRLATAHGLIGAVTTIAAQWILEGRRRPRAEVAAAAQTVVVGTLRRLQDPAQAKPQL